MTLLFNIKFKVRQYEYLSLSANGAHPRRDREAAGWRFEQKTPKMWIVFFD